MSEKYCRLCLCPVNDNFQMIEAYRDVLNILSLNLNLNISKEAVMCFDCMNSLQLLSNFKSVDCKNTYWFYEEEFSLPNIEPPCSSDRQERCRICTKFTEKNSLLSLQENMLLVNMIQKHIPEWNLNDTEQLSTCYNCLELLKNLLRFVTNCITVEETINRYIEVEGTNVSGQIELNDVHQYKFEPLPEYETIHSDFIEMETRNGVSKEDIVAKSEAGLVTEVEMAKSDLDIEYEDLEFILKREYYGRHQDTTETISNGEITSLEKIYKCELCTHDTNQEEYLYKGKSHLDRHVLSHESPSQVKMYKCDKCTYQTKHKNCINSHQLIHKSPSEITMYKCNICEYKTKYKGNFKGHKLIHKSPSEVQMYKCQFCKYEAKQKNYLSQHMKRHKGPLEVTMYKCEICPYQTNQKGNLHGHTLVHKSPLEVTMYKCEKCPYETKHKQYISIHMLTHKNPSEIQMYKCNICGHETKRKSYLSQHMETHIITIYRCENCPYETKHKNYIEWHTLTHDNPSMQIVYKCELCSYESNQMRSVLEHVLVHNTPSEATIYTCEKCPYTTEHMKHFNSHMLTHKGPSDAKMFKCKICAFEAKRKAYLDRHMLAHKIDKFKCGML